MDDSDRSLTYSQFMLKKEQEKNKQKVIIEKDEESLTTSIAKEENHIKENESNVQMSFSEYMAQKEKKKNDIELKVIFVEESNDKSKHEKGIQKISKEEIRTSFLLTCKIDQNIGYILKEAIHHVSHGPDCNLNDGIELNSICEELSNIRLDLNEKINNIFKNGDIVRVLCSFPDLFVISENNVNKTDIENSSDIFENSFDNNSCNNDINDDHDDDKRQIHVTISFVEHGANNNYLGQYSELKPSISLKCDRDHPVSWLLSEALRSCEEYDNNNSGESVRDNEVSSSIEPSIEVFYLRLPPSIEALDLSEDIGNLINEKDNNISLEAVCNSTIDSNTNKIRNHKILSHHHHEGQLGDPYYQEDDEEGGVSLSLKDVKDSLKQGNKRLKEWWYACDKVSMLPSNKINDGKIRICMAGYTDAPGRNTGSQTSFGLARKIADAVCASDPIKIETWFSLYKTRKDYLSFCKLLQQSRSIQFYRPDGASFIIWIECNNNNDVDSIKTSAEEEEEEVASTTTTHVCKTDATNLPSISALAIGGLYEFREWALEQDLTTETIHQLTKKKYKTKEARDDDSNNALKKAKKKPSLPLVRIAAYRVLKSLCDREASMRYDSFTAYPAGTCQGGEVPDVAPGGSGFIWRQEPVVLL